jgi:phosphatidate cytidylyltransferase
MAKLSYPAIPLEHAAGIGGLVSVIGVVGDLIESMFKRASGIKDTGGIMPGHGGLLDRVDSLLFTVPAAWVYLRLAGLG